jgi:hypothetical protein
MLYYSPSEALAFWVPGTRDSSSALLLIHEIQEGIRDLSKRTGNASHNCSTAIVQAGDTLKGTRVFWTYTDRPDGAKIIPSTYNMWSWLER